jgi:hypothetical protein
MGAVFRVFALAFTFALPLFADSAKPVVTDSEGQRAFDDLAALYNKKVEPDYQGALKDLADPKKSQASANYLLALFEQSFADETNGRASWIALPYWGGGEDNPARNFRTTLANAFADSASTSNALPDALWLIDHDLIEDNIVDGMKVLCRIHNDAANMAIGTILAEPHPSQAVLILALEEASSRHLVQDIASVVALEQSYRPEVRKAAASAAFKLGESSVSAYDTHAPLPPRMVEFLKTNSERLFAPLPTSNEWEKVDSDPLSAGWLVSQDYFQWHLMSFFLREEDVAKHGRKLQSEPLDIEINKIVGLRAEITALQDKPEDNWETLRDKRAELSRRGMLSAQFEPNFLSLPELTAALWYWQRGDVAHCRELLAPCFSAADDDRWLDWAAQDYLGNVYHLQMVEEFCDDQDFPAALALAKHLSKPYFDGYKYQHRANELAAQLTRKDPDANLRLPTLPEWWLLQGLLSRDGQIDYLGRRLKFLHVMQDMQPGDVYYDSAMPYSLSGIYCINPNLELKRMDLNAHDLAALAPYAADQDYMLTYSYFRDFHPSRTLHRVSWAVEKLANDIAGKPAERSPTIPEMLDGTGPKPIEILSRNADGTVYFTANPSGDVVKEFRAWALDQPPRGFIQRWWQTPTALLISTFVIYIYFKRRNRPKPPSKSLTLRFIRFLSRRFKRKT